MTRLLCLIATAAVLVVAAPATAAYGGATVKLAKVGKLGKVLVRGNGRTLYLFEKDKHGKSSCSGACAKVWAPLLTTGKPKASGDVHAALLGTTKRSDGHTQVTYNGHPLYTYDDDEKAGDAHGQDVKEFGAEWYVVNVAGKVVHGDA